MGWPHWQTWKLGFLEATTHFFQGLCVTQGGAAASETSLAWLRFLPLLPCPRDLGGSVMPDLKKPTSPISWKLVFSARSHLVITETSSCTG